MWDTKDVIFIIAFVIAIIISTVVSGKYFPQAMPIIMGISIIGVPIYYALRKKKY